MDKIDSILADYQRALETPRSTISDILQAKQSTCKAVIGAGGYGLSYKGVGDACCLCRGRTHWELRVRGWEFPLCDPCYSEVPQPRLVEGNQDEQARGE